MNKSNGEKSSKSQQISVPYDLTFLIVSFMIIV